MIPILGIVGWSGTGKTTLLKKLIPALNQRGIRTGLIKHTHHNMDVDKPGKDSYELRKAGASQTLVASAERWALMTETPDEAPLDLQYLASRMDQHTLDIILVEGFKHEAIPKLLLYREGAGRSVNELSCDEYAIALVTDIDIAYSLPVIDINDAQQVAEFIEAWLKKQNV
ncbi:molybdopterin-guanine dinucleotide biosynthesis protein MobB [Atlantibacter hermannii]|uniref:molybdopterin-guanine dinucleotide biosynthesis protein MobB n=1 Tax=Atlantibacter hermannii TaxID=565 RepID=UPI00290B75FA|nr:molybdopterin-guanine dinucleotide biosynthesis protein MobB [Atlantibacter hermannii]MDU7392112.1 molybdopterin-guanine dinucleotide biosynthesis protein MobB [Atlantibacter hermannii]